MEAPEMGMEKEECQLEEFVGVGMGKVVWA